MKKSIYLILLLIEWTFIGCEKDYAVLEISAPHKIVMEVGDSLLIHWEGKCPVRTNTKSVYYSSDYGKGGDCRYVPDSAICYVKEIVENGEKVYESDMYLYAQRAGRDTLMAEMITIGHDCGTMFYYPILVVNK